MGSLIFGLLFDVQNSLCLGWFPCGYCEYTNWKGKYFIGRPHILQPLLLDLYESIADELNAVHSVRELLSKGIGLTPIVPTLFRIKGHGAFADGLQLYRESVRRGLSAAGTTTRRSVWPVVLPIIAVILFVVKIALF